MHQFSLNVRLSHNGTVQEVMNIYVNLSNHYTYDDAYNQMLSILNYGLADGFKWERTE